jgi:hypothetical protein
VCRPAAEGSAEGISETTRQAHRFTLSIYALRGV